MQAHRPTETFHPCADTVAVGPAMPDTWKTVPAPIRTEPDAPACLIYIHPITAAEIGARFDLPAVPVTVGREDECEIRLTDPSVSRLHARLQPTPAGPLLLDLGSSNGTFVNEDQVSRAKLKDGDYVRFGGSMFRYLAGGNVEAAYHQEVRRLGLTDPLTGAHNQRSLLDYLARELARCARQRQPLSILLFDIDHFKAVNDRLGHLAGDHALRELVGRVRGAIRKEDVLGRYGGEEFVVLLPGIDRAGTTVLGERLRGLVEQQTFEFNGQSFAITISLGLASAAAGDVATPSQLLDQADRNLYRAKQAGRNQLVG